MSGGWLPCLVLTGRSVVIRIIMCCVACIAVALSLLAGIDLQAATGVTVIPNGSEGDGDPESLSSPSHLCFVIGAGNVVPQCPLHTCSEDSGATYVDGSGMQRVRTHNSWADPYETRFCAVKVPERSTMFCKGYVMKPCVSAKYYNKYRYPPGQVSEPCDESNLVATMTVTVYQCVETIDLFVDGDY